MLKKLLLSVLLGFTLTFPCISESKALELEQSTDKVSVKLFASTDRFLIRLQMKNSWHTNWINPGDVGLATKIKIASPKNYTIIAAEQSIPGIYNFEGFTQYGYKNVAYFSFDVSQTEIASQKKQDESFNVHVSWLACKDECVPEFITFSFNAEDLLPAPSVDLKQELAKAVQTFPIPYPSETYFEVKNNRLLINLENFLYSPEKIHFIPYATGLVTSSTKQKVGFEDNSVSIEASLEKENFKELPGIVITNEHAFKIAPKPGKNLKIYQEVMESYSLIVIILMSFIGGIILNFMPCVFPILSIKAISLVQNAYNKAKTRIESIIYFWGVITSFMLIATILIIMRASGEHIGWGFQLQSPIFVSIMIAVFFLVFLMLIEVINFRAAFANHLGQISFTKKRINAFLTGFFAVLIASPCTAPFMGIAIGYTLSQSVFVFYLVFLFLSIGYALPFTLIGFFPKTLHKIMPKPGAWMRTLKMIFAIPILLTCVWLSWVLYNQLNTSDDLKNGIDWQAYDEEKIEELVSSGEAVFINFSAKWCITCLANEKIALHSNLFQKLIKRKKIHMFKGDWTNHDSNITKALAKYNRNSIPLYIYYDNNNPDYELLPQLITPSILERYIIEDAEESLLPEQSFDANSILNSVNNIVKVFFGNIFQIV